MPKISFLAYKSLKLAIISVRKGFIRSKKAISPPKIGLKWKNRGYMGFLVCQEPKILYKGKNLRSVVLIQKIIIYIS